MTAILGLDRSDREIDIPALIDILHQTGERLEQLTAGEVDTVMDRSGRTFLLRSAQNQLRLSEAAKQAAILNALPAHIVLLDKQGTIVTANAAWRKFAQTNGFLDANDGVGTSYLTVCDRTLGSDAAEAQCTADGIRAVLEGRSTYFSTEYTLRTPSQDRGFLLTVTPVTDDTRGGAVVMHLDISAQRRTEDSLHESQELLRSVVDTMPIRVFWKDRDSRYLGCNTLFAQDAGASVSQQVIGKTDDEMPWRAQAEQYRADNRAVMESGISRLDLERPLMVAGGATISTRVSSVPLRNENGETIGLLGMYRDMSSANLAAAELVSSTMAKDAAEAANRAKSSFLANMSHEIRTPMNAIIGLTHLLRVAGVTPQQEERMGKIEQAGKHLLSIISDILDISKIEADRVELESTDFHLSTVLNNIQSLTGEQAQAKGLTIDIQVDSVPLWLRGDPTRLRQALLNFVSNAVKFTARGVITIRAILLEEVADDVLVRFEVQDTGTGIPADKLPMLFQAFAQADSTTTRVYGGTGLGLTIARRLAGLMGGEAGASSTVGVGSTFWFTAHLGRGEGEMPTVALVEDQDAEKELRKRPVGAKVLLADDNEINSEIAQEILRSVGIAVDTAENGVEAVAMSGMKDYDLILMDMHMPEMDGLDATRAIRLRPSGCTTPILAMTAAAFDEDRRRCEESGMNDFITKPVERKAFFAKLLKWLPIPTPATVDKPAVNMQRAAGACANNTDCETILVVDDVPDNISLLVDILGGEHRVTFATNGPEALVAALAQPQPSLILLDVMMPGMDGYEVCRRLKADIRTTHIPVIFLTAHMDVNSEEFGLQIGAVDYLHKPCHPVIVRQRVNIHLKLHSQSLDLEERVRERTHEIELTRLEIVRRLGRAGEYRDNETGMHVIRMSKFCNRLALASGLSIDQAALLQLAAPMHDIGKIGIPDHILLKPGRLTPDEWTTMQRHAAMGAEIIGDSKSDLLTLARNVALTHHERWDGTGYPNGLAAEAIPIEGRIAAIADVYDALTSVRPYKHAWTSDDAMAYIVRESARAFDPELVELFTGLLPEIATIQAKYADEPRAQKMAPEADLLTGTATVMKVPLQTPLTGSADGSPRLAQVTTARHELSDRAAPVLAAQLINQCLSSPALSFYIEGKNHGGA